MRRSAAQKEETRKRILEEAAMAMRVQGHEGISVADLMKRAGLTHGGFYAHFASRDDLVAHAVDRMFNDSRAILRQYLGEKPDADGLAALIDFYLSEHAMLRMEQACPLPTLSGEASRLPKAARLRFEVGLDTFREGIRRALESSGVRDAEGLASSVMAEMIGTMAMARVMSDKDRALAILSASRHNLKERLGLAMK
ncbi:regulatory protein TetR [Sphingobium chlorophenolicum L-1]|uniref:Regulatory protein TetR n=1 Tax=Sphingobium chlorophenolicum L-1 TaxID=690566 RepID=F6F1M5_SPHCR|nr:TetR/AcrR family transcriptional regulator [Sphingobium chlorophenolicum]AEG51441.1 regulatory protein TetR [Sphingobium chlorophenolicum L-1]